MVGAHVDLAVEPGMEDGHVVTWGELEGLPGGGRGWKTRGKGGEGREGKERESSRVVEISVPPSQ
jgi:hypothetical protein